MARWDAAWFVRLNRVIADLPFRPAHVQSAIRRELARDPIAFAILYLRKHIRSRETGDRITFSGVHLEWAGRALTWSKPVVEPMEDRHAYVAPRSMGKSTWWFLILPLWAAANGYLRFVAAFAHSTGQAEAHLATFRKELDGNALLQLDYPDLCAPARRQSGGTVADRQAMIHTRSGFTFAARGADAAMLGLKVDEVRPDALIIDDIEPDESNYSPYLAEKRLRTLIDAIFPLSIFARVVMVGTVTMPNSIIHQLVKHAAGMLDAAVTWPAEEKINVHHHRPITTGPDGSQQSIWPEKWPLTWLLSRQNTREYAKNYDNNPMGIAGAWWAPDDFRRDMPAGKVTKVFLWVDPPVTVSRRSDPAGIAIVGIAPTGNVPADVVQDAIRTARATGTAVPKFEPHAVVFEATEVKLTGQPLAAHATLMIAQFEARTGLRVLAVLAEVNQGGELWKPAMAGLPVPFRTYTSNVSKEIRFGWALDHYQDRRVWHPDPDRVRRLEEQALSYPRLDHEDVLDAGCAGVVTLLGKRMAQRDTTIHPT